MNQTLVSLQPNIIPIGEANYEHDDDVLDLPLSGGEDDDGCGDIIPGLLASLPHILYHRKPLSSHQLQSLHSGWSCSISFKYICQYLSGNQK